jgi:hypothetical protein
MDWILMGVAWADYPLAVCTVATLVCFALTARRLRRLPYLDPLVSLIAAVALVKLTHKQPVLALAWLMLLGGVYLAFRAVFQAWRDLLESRRQADQPGKNGT